MNKKNSSELYKIVEEINEDYWLELDNASLDIVASDWKLLIDYYFGKTRDEIKVQIIVDKDNAIRKKNQ